MNDEHVGPRPQPKKRVRDKAEKIERMYKCFFELLERKGYSGVSTNHVAEAAGVSIGTLYRYFPQGKQSILQAYFDSTQEEIFNIEALEAADLQDLDAFFRKYLAEFVRVHRENKVYHQAYEQAMLENPEALACYTRKVTAFIGEIATRLHRMHPAFHHAPVTRVTQQLLLVFNVFEALTRQHLFIMPLLPTDAEYVDFLMHLLDFFSATPRPAADK